MTGPSLIPIPKEKMANLLPLFLEEPSITSPIYLLNNQRGKAHADQVDEPCVALVHLSVDSGNPDNVYLAGRKLVPDLYQFLISLSNAIHLFPQAGAETTVAQALPKDVVSSPYYIFTGKKPISQTEPILPRKMSIRPLSWKDRQIFHSAKPPYWFNFIMGEERAFKEGWLLGLFSKRRLVSVAGVHDYTKTMENIAVFTAEKYRGKGFACLVCRALLKEISRRGRNPLWTCSADNIASQNLAKSLGLIFHSEHRIYRLP
jgi:RimJ/RimL family protein N-acetyltransferase